MISRISRATAVALIENSNGRIFSCDVLKRHSKEMRTFRARFGPSVQKGVKGVGLPFSPKEKNLIPVFLMSGDPNRADEAEENRRFIAVEGIQRLTIDGMEFEVSD